MSEQQYAEGGYIGGWVPHAGDRTFVMAPGTSLMTLDSFRALGLEDASKLFPNTQFELVISLQNVKDLGPDGIKEIIADLEVHNRVVREAHPREV